MTETPNKRRGRKFIGSGKAITRNVTFTPEQNEMLERKMKETGHSMSEIVRLALERMDDDKS